MERADIIGKVIEMFPRGRLVDLGSGHGGYARLAARLGWEVTAVDARTDRFPEPRPAEVTWVQADVRDFDLDGYDLVLCLGLFYHLTLEDQVHLLRRCRHPMVIDTHVDHGEHPLPLSDPVEIEGYRGRFYKEANLATSSWGNDRSFWPTLDSLHRMLRDNDFPVVLTADPWIGTDRAVFVALP